MVIKPKLAQRVKADGTVNVIIYLYDKKTRLKDKISTEHFVEPHEWDRSEVNSKLPQAKHINVLLKGICLTIEEHWLKNQQLTPADLKAWYEEQSEGIKPGPVVFTPITYYANYVQLCKDGIILNKKTKERLSEGTCKAINSSYEHAVKYWGKKPFTFASVSSDFYDGFVIFMRSENYKQNYIGKSIKHFKQMMAYGLGKVHANPFKDYSLTWVKAQKIRLTPAEVAEIIKVDLSKNPELISEHERFQVAYNLILRFSDTINISEKNIIEKNGRHYLSAFTQKTRKEILLPIKKEVYAILKKNNFTIKAANSKSNKKLKKIGSLAKINTNVTITEFKNGVKSEVVYKKHQLMETHTTRRSAARNLYDAGLDPLIIQVLGGWSSQKQMLEYIDIDLEYAASKAVEHPFFD
jgi:site-specific recombinase XerD